MSGAKRVPSPWMREQREQALQDLIADARRRGDLQAVEILERKARR